MSRDLRKYARQTNIQLMAGGLFLLFIVGDGLIYLIYGKGPAVMGLVCLLAGLFPLVLVWLALLLIEWIVRRADQE
jgi:uncharacterized SAM-binding protein YcdF (DUF218 family)